MPAHGDGGQVLLESSQDNAVITVVGGDLAPDDSELGVVLHVGRFIDVGHLLSKVIGCVLPVLKSLDFNQCLVAVLLDLTPAESGEYTTNPETDWWAVLGACCLFVIVGHLVIILYL